MDALRRQLGFPIFTKSESIDDLFARYGQSYRLLVMIAGMGASFTMVVSGTIVNVAVPDVMGAFGVGLDQAQLMTSAFNIAMVTSQLLNAWIVAAFGQRLHGLDVLLWQDDQEEREEETRNAAAHAHRGVLAARVACTRSCTRAVRRAP